MPSESNIKIVGYRVQATADHVKSLVVNAVNKYEALCAVADIAGSIKEAMQCAQKNGEGLSWQATSELYPMLDAAIESLRNDNY